MRVDILVKDFEIVKHAASRRTEHLEETTDIYITLLAPQNMEQPLLDMEYLDNVFYGNARIRFIFPDSEIGEAKESRVTKWLEDWAAKAGA